MTRLPQAVIAGALMFVAAACAPQSPASSEESTEGTTPVAQASNDNVVRTTVFGPPRLSPSEVKRFQKKASNGDFEAMGTLSVHHFAGGESDLGHHWLREAAKLGDCAAILHLVEDDFRGVTPDEMPHWQNEKKRLGCNHERDARAKPQIRINGVLQPPE